jgi:formate hydrogenlyase subunit 3/multisubunit Na+/H+ antiporter MnhD subunit
MALTGMGVVLPDRIGVDTAYLVLVSILVVRLPLYVLARRAVTSGEPPATGPLNLLVGFALSGVAPFAGFAARVYLVRATTELSWPLAWLVVGALFLWLLHGFRLGRSLGRPTGRAAAGVAVVLAISLPLGIVPWLVLRAGGL